MKKLDEFLKESVKFTNFSNILKIKNKLSLNEADDDADAGDDTEDAGGDEDPFADIGGDDAGGDDLGGNDAGFSNGGSDTENKTDEKDSEDEDNSEEEKKDDHEDDPDFTKGVQGDDVTLNKTPAGKMIYDSKGVMKGIQAVIETLPEKQLEEIDAVKNALELIFNGKKLKPEDLEFENVQNAIFLIGKIQEGLDNRTINYMDLKLKEPLIKQRDENKAKVASMKKDNDKVRDTILKIDTKKK